MELKGEVLGMFRMGRHDCFTTWIGTMLHVVRPTRHNSVGEVALRYVLMVKTMVNVDLTIGELVPLYVYALL